MRSLTASDEIRVLRAAYAAMSTDRRRSLYAITRDIVKTLWKVDVGDESRLADLPEDTQVRVCDVLAMVASVRHVVLDGNIGADDFEAEPAKEERAGWCCTSCNRTLYRTDDVVRVQVGRADRPKSFCHYKEFGNVCWECFREWCGDRAFFVRRVRRDAASGDTKAEREMIVAVRRRRAQRGRSSK